MPSQWFVRGGGNVYGPLDDARLRRLVVEGKINETTDVATQASGPWHPAARVRGLFLARSQNAPPGAATNPLTDSADSPHQSPVTNSEMSNESSNFPATAHLNAVSLPLCNDSPSQPSPVSLRRMGPEHIPAAVAESQECPSCANECALNARVCPKCGYRFPNHAPLIIGGLVVAVLVIGCIAATIVHKRQEEAEIWRQVHRQSQERQETLKREISDGYKRLGDRIIGR
jgi:hypothetical protein